MVCPEHFPLVLDSLCNVMYLLVRLLFLRERASGCTEDLIDLRLEVVRVDHVIHLLLSHGGGARGFLLHN